MIRQHYNTVRQFVPRLDVVLLSLVILAANTHLVAGNFSANLVFLPRAFLSGDWWRLFTFPFVHTGWYHLFLDAGAFLILYTGLPEKKWGNRLMYIGVCSIFSLTAVWLTRPEIHALGLNGLSGIGHGLMALSTLEMAVSADTRRVGAVSFGVLIAKSLFELLTGEVLFHFGLCGTPLAATHAGGILGGICLFARRRLKSSNKRLTGFRISDTYLNI